MTATGTVKASFESKLPERSGITPAVSGDMWRSLGREYVAIVIAEISERTEPANAEDKDPSVKLRVLNIELPRDGEEANWLRELCNAWYRRRTSEGTLENGAGTAESDAATARAILEKSDLGAFLPEGTTVSVNRQPVETFAELASSLHLHEPADA